MAGESHQVLKNITRVRDEKKHLDGYYVRIQWKKQSYSKFFSLVEYNTEETALNRAIEWRDETEALIGKPRTERQVLGVTKKSNTGVKGICRMLKQHYKNGKPCGEKKPWLIVTALDANGKIVRTGVSIAKHGEQKALEIARRLYKERNYC
jgi:hypothetical protein